MNSLSTTSRPKLAGWTPPSSSGRARGVMVQSQKILSPSTCPTPGNGRRPTRTGSSPRIGRKSSSKGCGSGWTNTGPSRFLWTFAYAAAPVRTNVISGSARGIPRTCRCSGRSCCARSIATTSPRPASFSARWRAAESSPWRSSRSGSTTSSNAPNAAAAQFFAPTASTPRKSRSWPGSFSTWWAAASTGSPAPRPTASTMAITSAFSPMPSRI